MKRVFDLQYNLYHLYIEILTVHVHNIFLTNDIMQITNPKKYCRVLHL